MTVPGCLKSVRMRRCRVVQELYEKKLVTYPRTDARVLSTAVAKEISRNLNGLMRYQMAAPFAQEILEAGSCQRNWQRPDMSMTSRLPTTMRSFRPDRDSERLSRLPQISQKVYQVIVPPVFEYILSAGGVSEGKSGVLRSEEEQFFSSFKVLVEEGYLKVAERTVQKERRQMRKNAEEKTDDIQ